MTNSEFFEALRLMEKEKGIPVDYLAQKIESAIVAAVRRDYSGKDKEGNDIVFCRIDPETETFDVSLRKTAVDEITDPETELLPEDARQYNPAAMPGDVVEIPLDTKQFGRIVAQTAKHVIRQGIREAERGQTLKEFRDRNQELVTGTVQSIDPRTGNATLEIGRGDAILPKAEQVPGETLREGQHVKVYVVDVKEAEKGPRILISRTHPGLVKRLFEMEVPEIFDGTIEIRAVSREAGSRTKLAVSSKDPNVDAKGACIGARSARVNKIVEELGGEKIDIVKYSDDPASFIAEALSPARVVAVELDPAGAKACHVRVPDEQLSLAIGNKGQNARLAARLTGWKIDIRPESGYFGEAAQE